jgi:hypothetical protein
VPSALLGLALVGIFCRDLTVQDNSGDTEPEEVVREPEIDKEPRVALLYLPRTMQFGLTMAQKNDGTEKPKKLTFIRELPQKDGTVKQELTSFPAVRIDGKAYTPGKWFMVFGSFNKDTGVRANSNEAIAFPGHMALEPVKLEKDSTGQHEGQRSAWLWDRSKIRFTQVVESIAGQPDPATDKRYLDTYLVRFTVKNEDTKPHRVGLRFILDTYIGANDGVPFYVPRKDRPLIDTQEDFPKDVPDYIQALELPKLDKPGTVAQVSLRLGGGLEAPDHVSLTHYIPSIPRKVDDEVQVDYDIPMASIQGNPAAQDPDQKKADSAVVMYWAEKELAPGQERKLGFAYGLGQLASGEGGRLGVTPPTNPQAGEDFPLTAYVSDPVEGQTVELILPRGLKLVEGNARQAVPAVAPDAASRNSSVTWKVRTDRAGTYKVWVRSGKDKQALTLVVAGSFYR